MVLQPTAGNYTAVDLYCDMDNLRQLRGRCLDELSKVDVLLLPTAPAMYTVAEVLQQEAAEKPR